MTTAVGTAASGGLPAFLIYCFLGGPSWENGQLDGQKWNIVFRHSLGQSLDAGNDRFFRSIGMAAAGSIMISLFLSRATAKTPMVAGVSTFSWVYRSGSIAAIT